jgi:pyruvate dehydrogenase E2 component (dihydrolipoamide acetyltransferase)
VEIRVPDLGSFKDVAVIELLVAPGDTLELDTPIATLETDKATMDVPSTQAGKVMALHISRGMKVNSGDLVATVEAAAAAAPASTPKDASPPANAVASAPVAVSATAAPAATPPVAAPSPVAPVARADLAPITAGGSAGAHAGPSVRRLARELGVDISVVSGLGL